VTDFSRLMEYIHDYFPEGIYDTSDIEEWAEESVPAWKYMDSETKGEIVQDWEDFIVEEELEDVRIIAEERKPSVMGRIKSFFGKLFGRG